MSSGNVWFPLGLHWNELTLSLTEIILEDGGSTYLSICWMLAWELIDNRLISFEIERQKSGEVLLSSIIEYIISTISYQQMGWNRLDRRQSHSISNSPPRVPIETMTNCAGSQAIRGIMSLTNFWTFQTEDDLITIPLIFLFNEPTSLVAMTSGDCCNKLFRYCNHLPPIFFFVMI